MGKLLNTKIGGRGRLENPKADMVLKCEAFRRITESRNGLGQKGP